MVTQFCQGDSVEYNDVSRYFIETSRDMHYVNGLMSDTKQSRHDNFKSCLNELGDYVKQKKNIRKVIFPTGVGRRGKMDHEWNVAYLKELRSFAHQLDLNNVKVMLLGQEEGTKNLGGLGGFPLYFFEHVRCEFVICLFFCVAIVCFGTLP